MGDSMDEPWTEADDVIEEVRQIRRKLFAQFDNDPVKFGEFLMESQKRHGDRLWAPPARARQGKPG